MSEFRFPARVQGLRDALVREQVEAVVVSYLENVRYLTGFTGSNALVILTARTAHFLTDGRYAIQSAQEVGGFERVVLPQGSVLAQAAGDQIKPLDVRQVAFEEAHLSVKAFEELRSAMPDTVTLGGKSDLVETLRQRKDAHEIAALRRAVALADACFDHLRLITKSGVTEKALAWEIEVFLRSRGAPRLAFESIVASGPNGALPHAKPSDRRLGESGGPEFVVFDYGAEVDGYCSDITRTLLVGTPTPRHVEVYQAVLRAQRAALAAIRPGVTGKEVDQVARDVLGQAGLAERFTHSLGHSLGRVTHDGVGFSPTSEVTLAPGMVLTVEPGVYLENWGGIRIEDDIVVTDEGCAVLTQSTKEMVIV